ncbi:MAG: 4Fe-4S binding protein [Burkholderiaceae bacterium]
MKTRGLAMPVIDADRCTGCGWCVAVCPPHVLSLQPQGVVKISVLDDAAGCTGCALCAVRCPFDAIAMVRRQAAAEPVDLI